MKHHIIPNHLRNEKYCVGIIADSLKSSTPSEDDDRYMAKIAARNGIASGAAHYFPQLARYPGDPEAFVTSKSEIKAVLQKRGWSATGIVDHDSDATKAKEPYEPAPDLVERYVQKHIDEHPNDAKHLPDVRQEIKKKLAGNQETVDSL